MSRPSLNNIFTLIKEYGIKYAVCSPGSRNAELLQEINDSEEIRKIVVVDERTAGFVALGISMVDRSPVVLICTSGTALLNYGPAVAEAFYQGLPLIVISADRPLEWIDQDDSQTIRQSGSLANIVKCEYDIDGNNQQSDYVWYVNRIVNEGLLKSLEGKPGPVHFNIHLDGVVSESVKREGSVRKIEVIKPVAKLDNPILYELAKKSFNRKIMIVAGFMPPDNKLQRSIVSMASLPNVCILAETVSNLHLPEECFAVDSVLFKVDETEERQLAPDIVISLGGALISRKLKEFLRRNSPQFHWSISQSDNIIDCFKALSAKIECEPHSFLKSLHKRILRMQNENKMAEVSVPEFNHVWSEMRKKCHRSPQSFPWSDLKALDFVLNALPKEANLFLSNGTAVRYGQIIPYRITHATYSNRGVSGIEGVSSTALGASLVYGKMTVLITGDMSFAYDLGALTTQLAPSRLKIVVLDNGGGEIFRFIKATCNLPIRETYLCADREIPIKALAYCLGWKYFYAGSEKELTHNLKSFFSYSSSNPAILHLDTRLQNNAEILTSYLNS